METMDIRNNLRDSIAKSLSGLGISVEAGNVPLEHPAELKNGDYSSGIALQYAKQAGAAPRALAEKIVEQLRSSTSLGPTSIQRIEVAGAGFINFYLAPAELAATIEKARAEDMPARRSLGAGGWGSNTTQKGRTIIMEYTDPNPFKEFHIGHLVPNALGESVSRLFQFSGAMVKRANYQGDVGIHVAKSIFILLEKNISEPTIADLSAAYPEGSKRYEEDAAAKTEIDAHNKKIYEKSDAKINDLYEKGRKLSLEHFEEIYKVLEMLQ